MNTEPMTPDLPENSAEVGIDVQRLVLPCPFCGSHPVRKVVNNILSVTCPQCVSVGFHNHVRFGCRADAEWNERQNTQEACEAFAKSVLNPDSNALPDAAAYREILTE